MIQKNIVIPKTARYFVLGEFSEQTENVWMVCHGYGQLANYFIKKFNILDNGKNVIIAPEALHRFYRNGFTGHVGASWMTKEERQEEIKDYINFLDMVYKEAILPNINQRITTTILGFSQATATVCRWLANKQPAIDSLILWGGLFPHDLQYASVKTYLNNLQPYLLIGDEDEFYKPKDIENHLKTINLEGIQTNVMIYQGKHDISEDVLVKLSNSLTKKANFK